jgi:hypothetical protein
MHAAVELSGPLYAEQVLTTAEVIATLDARGDDRK